MQLKMDVQLVAQNQWHEKATVMLRRHIIYEVLYMGSMH